MEKENQLISYTDYRKYDNISSVISRLMGSAYSNTSTYREKYRKEKQIFNNVFDKDIYDDEKEHETKLLRSGLSRINVEVAKRLVNFPEIDIEPVNKSRFDVKSRNRANMAKVAIEWMLRITNFAGVFQESKEEWFAYGDTFRMPFVRPNKKKAGKVLPGWEDVSGADLIIDPNARNIHSESLAKSAQIVAHSQLYSKEAMIRELGTWAPEYIEAGVMVSKVPFPNADINSTEKDDRTQTISYEAQTEYYEKLRIFDAANGNEMILWGGNAFPYMYNCENGYEQPDRELRKLIKEGKIEWSDKYKWKDSLGDNIIPIYQNFCYKNPDWPYNRGMVMRVADLQTADQILSNLKFDNIRQLMDYIFYISGGNAAILKNQIREYRNARQFDRDAFLHIPSSLNGTLPQFGVLKPEGIDVNWANSASQDIQNMAKNSTGINPQRQEIQKNTGVGQTEVLQEEKVDAIEEIIDDNIMEFQREIKGMIYFLIAYNGFGLNDVLLNYEKHSTETIGGKKITLINPNATISIKEAAKQLEGFDFDVIIDKSSMIKRSRFVEVQKITQVLGMLDPAATPERFKSALDALFKLIGVQLPDELPKENISEMKPTGGVSQFQKSAPPVDAPQGGGMMETPNPLL